MECDHHQVITKLALVMLAGARHVDQQVHQVDGRFTAARTGLMTQ
jgi:hypothetical protein